MGPPGSDRVAPSLVIRPPSSVYGLLAVAVAALAAGCATPLRPTGGPADQTAPRLVASDPAADTVNVRADRLTLTFSERVDPATAARALSVTPEFERPPEVRVRGEQLEVVFPDSLRPQTTYVVTLSTDLRDARGVALAAPLTVAFATGPTLDRGRIEGVVLDPATGAGVPRLDVFAYRLADTTRLPDPRTAAPSYRTQSGPDGRFALTNLAEAPFFVAVVEDRNRNRRADAEERFAAPTRPVAQAREVTTDSSGAGPDSAATPHFPLPTSHLPLLTSPFFVARLDTTAPALRRVRPLSDRRTALRFDESVTLTDRNPSQWALADSASGRAVTVAALYARAGEPAEVVVATGGALAPTPHRLRLRAPGAVQDSSANGALPFEAVFTPSAQPDTAQARFGGFVPAARVSADSAQTLRPDERAGVRFTLPLDSAAVRARVRVRNPAGAVVPYVLIPDADGLTYRLRLPLRAFTVAVQDGDSTRARRFATPAPDALGGIVGRVGADGPVLVEAYPEGGSPFVARVEASGAFVLQNLPPGAYRLRVVLDRNGNGRWDGGRLAPYAPPEPLRWLPEPVRVRARWDQDVGTVEVAVVDR